MTEAVAQPTPATPETPATPAPEAASPPAAKPSPSQRRDAALQKLRSGHARDPFILSKQPPAEPPPAEPEPAAEQGAAVAQEVESPAPEPEPGESVAQFKARLVRSMADLRKKDQALRERDQSLQTVQSEREKLGKELEELRAALKDPFKALKLAGTSYEELTRKYLAKEVSPPDESDVLREHVDERSSALERQLAELKAWKESAEKEKAERLEAETKARQREEHLTIVKSIVDASADRYPMLASIPGGAERLLNACYAAENDNPEEVAPALEKAIMDDLAPLVASPKVLAALLKSQPQLRETFRSILGPESSRKAQPEAGPRVLAADVVSAPSNPEAKPPKRTESERRTAALRRLWRAD